LPDGTWDFTVGEYQLPDGSQAFCRGELSPKLECNVFKVFR